MGYMVFNMVRKQEKKLASNIVLAALVVTMILISLAGTAIVESGTSVPKDVPVGSAKVNVNVAQSPARPTGHVSVFVLPKLG